MSFKSSLNFAKICTKLLRVHFCTYSLTETCSKPNFNETSAMIRNIDAWPRHLLDQVRSEVEVLFDFVSEAEESAFVAETAVDFKRLRYEQDHWDNAIKLYREIEKKDWGPLCSEVIRRIRDYAFPKDVRHLSLVHVLDLHKDGHIKPHIDSIRYCGETIAGISLLSDSVMRLAHKDNKLCMVDLLLTRRSLYVLRGIARREFTHEILGTEESYFSDKFVPRDRRISVMCRSRPNPEDVT